ncbi:MAG: hypothetical protein ACTTIC_04610 [Helicobacteraceae bacterium]
MKYFAFLFVFQTLLFSYNLNDFLRAYKDKDDALACKIGTELFKDNKRNEIFVQAYAFACLRSDNIDTMAETSVYIKNIKDARINAALLSTVIAIKKLLYLSLVDDYDISGLNFPIVDHVLSRVFTRYTRGEYVLKDGLYIFSISDAEKITMEKRFDGGKYKIYITEFLNSRVIKTHVYW